MLATTFCSPHRPLQYSFGFNMPPVLLSVDDLWPSFEPCWTLSPPVDVDVGLQQSSTFQTSVVTSPSDNMEHREERVPPTAGRLDDDGWSGCELMSTSDMEDCLAHLLMTSPDWLASDDDSAPPIDWRSELDAIGDHVQCRVTPVTSSSRDAHASRLTTATALHRSSTVTASCSTDNEDEGQCKRSVHLWQFLKELLSCPTNFQNAIRWLDQSKGIFKIEDSAHVARLWGRRKNRPAMNYDKLSRSIRQYYRKGIIRKTDCSRRLVYQFCPKYR